MATIKLPASPQSAVSKIPIVGTPLEVAEVKNIPPQLLFRYASVKPSLLQKVIDKVTDVVKFKSTGPPRQPYRCPRCQASDPAPGLGPAPIARLRSSLRRLVSRARLQDRRPGDAESPIGPSRT